MSFCDDCARGFKTLDECVAHIATHNQSTSNSNSSPNNSNVLETTGETTAASSDSGLFQCSHCERRFAKIHNLKTHLLVHSGQHPYRCKLCDKGFVRANHLSNHLKGHAKNSKSLSSSSRQKNRSRLIRESILSTSLPLPATPFNAAEVLSNATHNPINVALASPRVRVNSPPRSMISIPTSHISNEGTSGGETQSTSYSQYQCSKCNKQLTSLISFHNHRCEKSLAAGVSPSRQRMDEDEDENNEDLNLTADLGDTQEDDSEESTAALPRVFQCSHCPKVYKHIGHYKYHIKKHVGETRQEPSTPEDGSDCTSTTPVLEVDVDAFRDNEKLSA